MPHKYTALPDYLGLGLQWAIVGYALGGGTGWLFRRYGLCSDTIEAAEITTADGSQRWVHQDVEPELFCGLCAGVVAILV